MAAVLAHPFRLEGRRAVTVEDTSDAGIGQLIAVAATTGVGERPQVPGFGVSDPTFGSVDIAEINAVLSAFGPDVQVTGMAVRARSNRAVDVDLTWEPNGLDAL